MSRRDEETRFDEPWQAEVLALAMALQEQGHCTAQEWSEALGAAIREAQQRGDVDDGTTYYSHVLAAVERLVAEKGLASHAALDEQRARWEAAYRATPHGEPVTLPQQEGSK